MKGAYSTRGAAKKLNVSLITLQRHVAAETFPVPKIQQVGGIRVRLWTERDIARVRKELAKIKPGRKKKTK
jgi:hypothetical protein